MNLECKDGGPVHRSALFELKKSNMKISEMNEQEINKEIKRVENELARAGEGKNWTRLLEEKAQLIAARRRLYK